MSLRVTLTRPGAALHDTQASGAVAWWEAQVSLSTLQYPQGAMEFVRVKTEQVCLSESFGLNHSDQQM